jgi:SET domain-containing protein
MEGWGVVASQDIKKGTYVSFYTREITNEEAEQRAKLYDTNDRVYLIA